MTLSKLGMIALLTTFLSATGLLAWAGTFFDASIHQWTDGKCSYLIIIKEEDEFYDIVPKRDVRGNHICST